MAISKKNKVNYNSKRIKFSNTLAEEEASNYQASIKQDPIERIKETVKLILRVYGLTRSDLISSKNSNKITFKR